MIRITQIKLPVDHTKEDLLAAVYKHLKIKNYKLEKDQLSVQIVKKSIDARKGEVKYSYAVDVTLRFSDSSNKRHPEKIEEKLVRSLHNPMITLSRQVVYPWQRKGNTVLHYRPVVTGAGPAGLFCAYLLAKNGYAPIVLERGECVENRTKTIQRFWQGERLDPECNVQFGEGGAGTFSDGKLNTMVKDQTGRNTFVLNTFVKFGADESILYTNKPHIGTDVLSQVVRNMRQECILLGATFLFDTKLTDLKEERNGLIRIQITGTKEPFPEKEILTEVLVLAIGHSARDTFQMLYQRQILFEPKAFAVGVRIEHPRSMIDRSQYGDAAERLPAADYKLTAQTTQGRGVYSFCMCPGGYVVNSSSEPGMLCVNGMSYHDRRGDNSNSAIVVTVTPEDFGGSSPLAGMEFQRRLEQAAFETGAGRIPVQLYGDFKENRMTASLGEILPQTKGNYTFGNLKSIFPQELSDALVEGIESFGHRIKNFNRYDAVLSGVESRTSSPVKIPRNESFCCNIPGIYPCGEGAGYAGGITSAAMDGIRVFEAIADKYAPLTETPVL